MNKYTTSKECETEDRRRCSDDMLVPVGDDEDSPDNIRQDTENHEDKTCYFHTRSPLRIEDAFLPGGHRVDRTSIRCNDRTNNVSILTSLAELHHERHHCLSVVDIEDRRTHEAYHLSPLESECNIFSAVTRTIH